MNKVFGKCEFKQEGIYKEGQFLNGKFENVIAWAILSRECDERRR